MRPGIAWTLAFALACASVSHRDAWKRDWNDRVDRAVARREHPCGDFAFDPWADGFLSGCAGDPEAMSADCRERFEWVLERSEQCQVWQEWLLRNVNRHERRDDLPEPPTRVE
jgi:hypothetical protein